MNWVRAGLVIYAVLYLIGAYFIFRSSNTAYILGAYLLINGLLIFAGTIFERKRYHPDVSSKDENWEETTERFIDDTTGKEMVVHYNRKTGERNYVENDKK